MANELYPSWLKDRLASFTKEWRDRKDASEKEYGIDYDYFLKEFLDSLDVSYILDRQTGNLTIQVSPWLTIKGKLEGAEYNFSVTSRWEGDEFREFLFSKPYSIFLIKKNPQFLRDMIEDAKVLASEMTVQMKSHRQGDVLSSVVESYLVEIGAKKISLTVISRECCRLSARLFSKLVLTVDVRFDDYVERTDQLVSAMNMFPPSFKRLTFDGEWAISVRENFKRGTRTLSVWKGEPKQIRYDSPDIQAMTNTATVKQVGNKALYDTLRDCGYKYYMDQGVNVVITDRTRLRFNGNWCMLISDISDMFEDVYHVNPTDIISILRVIACLPTVSLRGFDECSSTKQFIDKLFGQEIQKFLLHNNCSYYHSFRGDMFVFSDKATVANMDIGKKVAGVCVKHNSNYISNYMTVLTNTDILYDLFTRDTVKARVIY